MKNSVPDAHLPEVRSPYMQMDVCFLTEPYLVYIGMTDRFAVVDPCHKTGFFLSIISFQVGNERSKPGVSVREQAWVHAHAAKNVLSAVRK